MTKKFSRNNLYNANWDYKLTPDEEEKQKEQEKSEKSD